MEKSIDLSTIVQLIKKQPVFSQLTDDEAEELASLFTYQSAKANDVVVKEGDPVDSVYLIERGTADVKVTSYKENQPIVNSVAILSSGDAIGLNETGFYSISGKRTASVVALTEMQLYRLSVAAFNGFSLSHTHVSEIMHRNVANIVK